MSGDRDPVRQQLKLYAPVALLVAAAFVVAYQFIKPAPPDRVVVATGSVDGAYHGFAQAYAERLAHQGITLELRPSAGSVENLRLLREGVVDLAFIQGGVDDGLTEPALESLGSLYYEPLWLFHRRDLPIDRISDLAGRRIAVGAEGSGTHALVSRLLRDNAIVPSADWRAIGGNAAAEALMAGQIDALFMVIAANHPLVEQLLRHPDIELVDLRRAKAYGRRYRFLSYLELPEGAVDLGDNIPPRMTRLLASTANLVAAPDLHPALVDLMLITASDVHRAGGWFETPGEFPKPALLAFPLNNEADRFYRHGPPLLQRFLPFWAASLIDRLKIMLLPLLVLLLPLVKVMPPIYQWRMRSRIYRWYEELEKAEERYASGHIDDTRLTGELDRIEGEVQRINVPLSFTDRLYHLRQHVELVRRKLLQPER